MSFSDSHAEWKRRKDEIERLAIEPAIEAWNQFEFSLDEESSANELGYPIKYFQNLVAHEFVRKLNEGMNFAEFPKFNSDLENLCWQRVYCTVKSDLSAAIDTSLCKQLRLKLLSCYRNGVSIQAMSQSFDIARKQTQALVVLALAEAGLTLEEIGTKFRVTRERARQLLTNLGVSTHTLRAQQSAAKESRKVEFKESIEAWITAHPGCYISEIAEYFGVTESAIREIKPQNFKRLVIRAPAKDDSTKFRKYSKEQILEALKMAYELRNPSMSMYSVNETQPLTGPFYEKLRRDGSVFGPSQGRTLQVFGTWKAACEEAGVPSIDAPRDSYELLWTDEQLIEQRAEFISTTDSLGVERFDEWCRLDNSRASSGTMRNQIGPWSESHELALLHLRKNWTDD